MNISHYGALLRLDLDDDERSIVKRLLAEAKESLVLATEQRKQHERRAHASKGDTIRPYGLEGWYPGVQPSKTTHRTVIAAWGRWSRRR
jgi:hypothetical protein